MASLTVAERKKLHDRAGGECAFAGCDVREPIQEAHIFARNDGGPRANPTLEKESREVYENFVMLCANHHYTIDHDEATYTVSVVKEMKAKHELDVIARGAPITEFTGSVHAEGTDTDSVTGARVTKPARFKAGTQITAKGTRTAKVTGLEVTGGDQ
jgi:hypothetical protein